MSIPTVTALVDEELTGNILGAAIDVHRELGPGFIESVYENALVVRLKELGLNVQQQVESKIYFHEVPVGLHPIDLLVESKVVIDLKAIAAFENIHYAVLRSQLRAIRCELGLLLNFSQTTLQIKRVLAESFQTKQRE